MTKLSLCKVQVQQSAAERASIYFIKFGHVSELQRRIFDVTAASPQCIVFKTRWFFPMQAMGPSRRSRSRTTKMSLI